MRQIFCLGFSREVCHHDGCQKILQTDSLIIYFRVTIVDPSVGHVVSTISAENVFELGFSPLGTYLITWQRPSKDANGDAVKNLKVWKVIETSPESNGDEHTVVGSFVQKSQTGWNLQYTFDESLCARVVTNEVQFFQSDNLSKVWNKLRVEGVSDFALSPGKNNSIAVFIPERKVSFPIVGLSQ
jgi:translation initiation factor 2A